MTESLYPTSPENLSKKITSLTTSYQLKAFLAILSIILFFALYVALVVVLAYLVYYAFKYDMGYINKLTIIMKIGAIAGSVMLFVFTLKFIFKLKNHKPNNRIKLDKKNYPKIWDFAYKICKETGAPKPKNIYVDPDVNAYVSYTNMWLSLFLPVKKELTIGLGLVSCLNLTEFKAVIAHEFGHFAQKSMKIGSYIISANTIIHDMIFSRDKWDDLLDQWRASDIRLSAAAWVITPIIWTIRQILNLFYQFLNIMYSSLSREMEFNADKVAVSTAGSDSIISALWELDNGYTCWNTNLNNAYLASQKKIYVQNLYTHNNLGLKRISNIREELINSLPNDSRGGKKYFSSSEQSKVNMYASHPPNDKRQDNAKSPYITCEIDKRTPWLLFDNNEELQEKATVLIYDVYFNKKSLEFSNADEFEAFIKHENKGKDLLEAYANTFENRFLHIPELKDLNFTSINLNQNYLNTIKTELNSLMKPVKEIENLMHKANQIGEGTIKETSFSFKNNVYNKKNLQEGYMLLLNEREKLFTENFKQWDTLFCSFHFALAKKNAQEVELTNLYKQHSELSNIYKSAVAVKNTILEELNTLQTRQDVTQGEVTRFGYRANDLYTSLNDSLNKLDTLNFVKLPNIDTISELKEAIIENGIFERETGNIFENGGFNKLINTLNNVVTHCQRLDQKSIISILAFHHNLHNLLEN
ncbi:M48 family metalloprotease [Mariniflexile jejuense]|uniref:M48 family metalloprotease n=1 Tax=Mariniflexile jejuense TaxID=1173582 RepID=A0ABW3JNC7_9FLAO